MNSKPPEMKMNKWHPVGAQAPSRSPPTQEEAVLPSMRLPLPLVLISKPCLRKLRRTLVT